MPRTTKQMVKNYYYLVLGILSILFSFTHALNGQNSVLPLINSTAIDLSSKTTIFYIWHIITTENFIFGIAFLIMAFYKDLSKVKFTARMIAIIMIARWCVIFGGTIVKNPNGIKDTLIDIIVILIYVALILLGTKVKNNSAS